ncbi:MAG: hypothetical protein WA667_17330 [Candidatus Nitrosopolaris sp.]
MNREEKEQYVIQLYKEGKSVREIAKLMHISFRDIGAITNKVKLQAERERGYTNDEVDNEPKSPESQAFKLFSEGKSPVEVVIALDLAADVVRAIYREYWELNGRYQLAQIYDEAKYDLYSLLRLHKIVKNLGMEEHDIIKVFELAKQNQLQRLLGKVEYLTNEIFILELQKSKSTNDILNLNRTIDQFQSSLPQKRRGYNNTGNLYPTYSEHDTSSYSIRLSYSDYWPWQ